MDIYIGKDGQVLGPYGEEEIRARLDADLFDGTEKAWHEGLDEWVNLMEVMKGEDAPAETEAATPEEAVEIESADQTDKTALFDLSDPNHKIIESAIREALGNPEGELTKADLDEVTELNLRSNQLTDVTALKDLTQLTVLYLFDNQLTDVTPLKDLTQLTVLHLFDNQLTDVTALKDLTQLTELKCDDNLAIPNRTPWWKFW